MDEIKFNAITRTDVLKIRQNATSLQKYMVDMSESERVVYCRHGRDYISVVAHQSVLQQLNPSL